MLKRAMIAALTALILLLAYVEWINSAEPDSLSFEAVLDAFHAGDAELLRQKIIDLRKK